MNGKQLELQEACLDCFVCKNEGYKSCGMFLPASTSQMDECANRRIIYSDLVKIRDGQGDFTNFQKMLYAHLSPEEVKIFILLEEQRRAQKPQSE